MDHQVEVVEGKEVEGHCQVDHQTWSLVDVCEADAFQVAFLQVDQEACSVVGQGAFHEEVQGACHEVGQEASLVVGQGVYLEEDQVA